MIGVVAGLALGAPPGAAQTLTDALIQAYQTSPLLEQSRAQLRSLDEAVPQARANLRPQISANAGVNLQSNAPILDGIVDTYQAGLRATLVLLDSGATAAAVESARNTVASARADLKDVEQVVLLNAVQAFLDVRRDLQFVALAQNDVRVLTEQIRAAQDRFEVGEITRTDVAQTEARLANSQSLLSAALGNLEISRAAYLAAVGAPPGDLAPPPPVPDLPATLPDATAIALRTNPTIIAAQYAERAAVYDFDRARAAGRPTVQIEGDVRWQDQSSASPAIPNDEVVGQLGLGASVPLYSGGRNSSLIRQAQAVLESRRFELQDAGRTVRQRVDGAWTQLEVARALIVARDEQVRAARIAAEGVFEEARLGARSQLDVLDADLERLEAEAEVVRANRDAYVAAYNLLAAMGLLTVEHLGLGIETYDPEANFSRVRSGPVGGYRTDVVDRIRSRWER